MKLFGINNSVHLHHRYIEEGRGSPRFVLPRTGETTAVATLAGMAGFIGLAFSDHRGLATLGMTGMLGLGMSILVPLLVMPAILGFLEERRQASEFPSPPRPLVREARVGRGTIPNPWTGFRIRTPDTEAENLETGSIVLERLENRIYEILLRIG